MLAGRHDRQRVRTEEREPVPENATEVTAAGIARLAGVGRAAVSNWRRRYADFSYNFV